LDTKAIVTSLADAPKLPAPAQPAVSVRAAAATHAANLCSAFTFTSPSLRQQPTGTIDVTHQKPGQLAAQRPERGGVLGCSAGDQDGLLACPDVFERHGDGALLQFGVHGHAVDVEEPAADLPHR